MSRPGLSRSIAAGDSTVISCRRPATMLSDSAMLSASAIALTNAGRQSG